MNGLVLPVSKTGAIHHSRRCEISPLVNGNQNTPFRTLYRPFVSSIAAPLLSSWSIDQRVQRNKIRLLVTHIGVWKHSTSRINNSTVYYFQQSILLHQIHVSHSMNLEEIG
jgi:hypothetical protein